MKLTLTPEASERLRLLRLEADKLADQPVPTPMTQEEFWAALNASNGTDYPMPTDDPSPTLCELLDLAAQADRGEGQDITDMTRKEARRALWGDHAIEDDPEHDLPDDSA